VDGDDDQLFAWVERDQFAYYLTVAYMTADPNDWPSFRRALHGALVATLYLDRHLDATRQPTRRPTSSTRCVCSTTSATATTRPSPGPASSSNCGPDAASSTRDGALTMSRQVFKRCTRCAKAHPPGRGDRRCPTCGSADYTWGFVVDIGLDPATGKRRRRRGGGFATRRDAEAALREVLTKRDRGQLVQTTTMTVREFLVDQWLPAMRMSIGPDHARGLPRQHRALHRPAGR
jgi:hypothetical protein